MNDDFYRQIILDHYNNPQNKVESCPDGYEVQKGVNPSCGDELEMYIKYNGSDIEDIKFNGVGCSICCSSASVLTNELNGLNNEEIKNKLDNFDNLLKGEDFDQELFEDAIAFEGISKFPARFKCAFLSWQTIKDFLIRK